MIVQTKILGRQGPQDQSVQVPPDVATLRALLAALVRHELAAYAQRRNASQTLQVLTPADLVNGVASGTYGRERRVVPTPPTEASAIERAVEAFGDGLFLVFVDGSQIEVLDAPLTLRPDSTLRLLRLVALVGA